MLDTATNVDVASSVITVLKDPLSNSPISVVVDISSIDVVAEIECGLIDVTIVKFAELVIVSVSVLALQRYVVASDTDTLFKVKVLKTFLFCCWIVDSLESVLSIAI